MRGDHPECQRTQQLRLSGAGGAHTQPVWSHPVSCRLVDIEQHRRAVVGDTDGHRPDVAAVGCPPLLLGIDATGSSMPIRPSHPAAGPVRSAAGRGRPVRRESSSTHRRLDLCQRIGPARHLTAVGRRTVGVDMQRADTPSRGRTLSSVVPTSTTVTPAPSKSTRSASAVAPPSRIITTWRGPPPSDDATSLAAWPTLLYTSLADPTASTHVNADGVEAISASPTITRLGIDRQQRSRSGRGRAGRPVDRPSHEEAPWRPPPLRRR